MAILETAASIFVDTMSQAIGELIGEDIEEKIKSLSTRNTFKRAMGSAIARYSSQHKRLALGQPLWQENGLFDQKIVVIEVAKILKFQEPPDFKVIARQWESLLQPPLKGYDFTEEAKLLLGYFENELRDTEVFRPVFEAKDIRKIADEAENASVLLSSMEKHLISLIDLAKSGFGNISLQFSSAPYSIRDQIRDYTRYIEEKTQGFVGRKFVFDRIEQFIKSSPRGYVIIRGDPGLGKSALAAHLVKTEGYIHHFNISPEGINKASDFLRNICAQLIAVYSLPEMVIPPEATNDAGFLNKLLAEVSTKLNGDKCIIVVDALDEADNLIGLSEGANVLYLPVSLPHGIYIIATARRKPINLRIDIPEQDDLLIDQDDTRNIADIHNFVKDQVKNLGIQTYINLQEIDDELFIDHMTEKSQGNFIYLRMVLPEIENGAYKDLELSSIPKGLQNYYEDHWRRMRRQSELDWFEYKLPVILALTVSQEPVSMDLLSDFSYIVDKRKIRDVLVDFDQFIYKTDIVSRGEKQRGYRWYHASFFEFIAYREEVADERINLLSAHRKIADKMLQNVDL